MNDDRITLRERWENIKADWLGTPREVRHTAVGWQPPGEGWARECGPSGTWEWYKIIRPISRKDSHEGKKVS